ncbi:hypothetical protein Tco_1130623, partial [Tanacetum coccineum]
YLQSSSDLDEITELQCLYLHKVRECDCLAQNLSEQTEFVSKEIYTKLLRSFAKLENHLISLEIAFQQCQEQLKNDIVCKEKASNLFRKEREQYFEMQDLKAQLQDKNIAIYELKKLIEKCKGKSVDTKFDKPSVVRQPNAQRIPKPSVLFSDSLERTNFTKKKSVSKTNESEGVAHKTNVSRPQPRSNQMKDKVVPNTSHVKFKKTEVEEHPRISSISNQTKSVTACNDSLNSRTLNVNVVCATCGKCVFNSNHDACVSKFLKDVNARTKKPNVVPISTRKPKSQANKSVATPHKKTVASESTITSSKSYYRMLYKKTSKAWKWWIAQQCPSAYKWVPKTKMKWVPKVRKPSIKHLHIFGCICYITRNGENLDMMKEKRDPCILVGYSTQSKGYRASFPNKSSSPTDNSALQDTHPSTNIHPTSEPSTPTNVHAEENNDDQAEFTNPFCTPVQEAAESSSRNIGTSNMHTFNQPQDSEYRWTKDHPLTQVCGNPSKPVQTR